MGLATFYTPMDPNAELPSFADIVHQHAVASPNSNLFLVPTKDRSDWKPVKYGQFDRFVQALALYYKSIFREEIKKSYATTGKAPVVNLLVSPAENLFAPLLGLNAAGITVIPTNPFLPPETAVEIARKANSCTIVIGGANVQHLVPQTQQLGKASNIDVHVLNDFELLTNFIDDLNELEKLSESFQQKYADVKKDETKVPDPAIIMHSTGSTNAPKLIPWSNCAILNQIKRNVAADGFLNGQIRKLRPDLSETAVKMSGTNPELFKVQRLHDIDIDKERVVFISKEPFAIAPLGIVLKILFLGVGWVVAFPRFKSTQFTVPELLKDLYDSHTLEYSIYSAELCNIAHYFNQPLQGEERETQQRYLEMMRAVGPLPVGGSRVERSTARACLSLGIRFQVTLGTTESGFVLHSKPTRCEKAWGKPYDQITEREIDLSLGMQMWPDTDGSFDETQGEEGQGELYIDSRDLGFSHPALANDGPLWRTRDLFTCKNLVDDNGQECKIWEYYTRKDDMVMLGNGENLAPNHMEDILRDILDSHPTLPVTDVLICGTSRPVPAIILETSASKPVVRQNTSLQTNTEDAPTQADLPENIRKQILDVLRKPLQELTATLPSFFPLREDRVLILQPGRRLPRSAKDVIMRGKAELHLSKDLDRLFNLA